MPDINSQQNTGDPFEILLIEDNPGNIRLIQEAFKTVESKTVLRSVTNGDDAVDLLMEQATAESESLPDLVLIDLNLPGRDGYEVSKFIRDSPQLCSSPTIVLTSSGASEDISRCYDAHVNAYLTKPTGIDEFASLVEAVEEFWFERVQLPPLT